MFRATRVYAGSNNITGSVERILSAKKQRLTFWDIAINLVFRRRQLIDQYLYEVVVFDEPLPSVSVTCHFNIQTFLSCQLVSNPSI